jgi:hypothetical protein
MKTKTIGLGLIAALLWAAGCNSRDPLLVTGGGGATAGKGGRGGAAGVIGVAGGGAGGGPGGVSGTGGPASAGTSGGGSAGGPLAACAPAPTRISNPCVYTTTSGAFLDLSVRGSLTSTGTTPPVGVPTKCLHRPQFFFTVQDTAGQSTTVGYDAPGEAAPALASMVGQTVSLRVRFAQQFQIDTDSVGFALKDSFGGLVLAAYGGIFHIGIGDAKLAPADLQGIEVTAADPLCSQSSPCGATTYHALQFGGANKITLASGASGTFDAGAARYVAYHVATSDLGPQGCSDLQDWQGWSLMRTCPAPGFLCVVGSCANDIRSQPICINGEWACPAGSVDPRTCGGCTGNPPPGCTCGDGGWICPTDGGMSDASTCQAPGLCTRPYHCIRYCGGPVETNSCCPCQAPLFDNYGDMACGDARMDGAGFCADATTEAACAARPSCHAVFVDPHNCGCTAIGCCARFSWCAEGARPRCAIPATISCTIPTPYCEGPAYVRSYTETCYEGCVKQAACTP